MRILAPNASNRVTSAQAPRRAAGGGFAVGDQEAPRSPAPAASLRTVGGIDALLALQGAPDPADRRQRAVRRGRSALDQLEELRAEVLAGTAGPATLARLRVVAADLGESSGDARLDAVLAEIELRVAVEIAKLTPRT